MKHILLGYRAYDFKDEKTGRQVSGVSLFTSFEREGVTGMETAKLNVNSIPSNIDDFLGVEFDLDFDNRGKIVQVRYPDPVLVSAEGKGKVGFESAPTSAAVESKAASGKQNVSAPSATADFELPSNRLR